MKKANTVSAVIPASSKEFSQVTHSLSCEKDKTNVDVKHFKSTKDEDKIITDVETSSEEFSQVPTSGFLVKKEVNLDAKNHHSVKNDDKMRTVIPVSAKAFSQVPTSGGEDHSVKKEENLDAKNLDSMKNDDNMRTVFPVSAKAFSQSTELSKKSLKYPEVRKEDLRSLDERTYINDTIIEFYLNFIYNEKLSSELQEKTYIFSTKFYQKILDEEDHWNKTNTRPKTTVEDNWLKNVDLFSKDFIIIPMLFSDIHWYLVIICFLSKLKELPADDSSEKKETRAQLMEQKKLQNSPMPSICFFDSSARPGELSKHKVEVAKILKNYFKCLRIRRKSSKPCDWGQITFKNFTCPQQKNGYDCGLFLLQFVECFFETPITRFEGTCDVTDWFRHEDIIDNRKKIRKIILEIITKRMKSHG